MSIELHVHLEGCVTAAHIRRWWHRSGFLFPPPSMRSDRSFERFLEHLRFNYNFINTPQAYGHVLSDYAKSAGNHGVQYAEVQINLALVSTWGLALYDVLDEMNTCLDRCTTAPRIRYLIDLPWQFSPRVFDTLFRDIDVHRAQGVRGIGLGGDETLANIDSAVEIARGARAVGLKILCHLGESGNPNRARAIAENVRPDRIGHGVRLARWLAERGRASPPVDVCLTSNLCCGVIGEISDHPLQMWTQSGVPVCISTDDPAIFGTSYTQEMRLAHLVCPGLSAEDLAKLAVEAAFDKEAAIGATSR